MSAIQELRRKGLTSIELWNVVLSSKKLEEEYQHQYPKIDWEHVKKLVSLCSEVKSKRGQDCYEALEELSKMASSESVPVLLEALADSHQAIKHTALGALSKIGGEEVIAGLELIQTEDVFFAECIEQILRGLKKEVVYPSREVFSSVFCGHSWRIIEEDELRYKVEVIYAEEKKKRVHHFYKEQDIFLSRVIAQEEISR